MLISSYHDNHVYFVDSTGEIGGPRFPNFIKSLNPPTPKVKDSAPKRGGGYAWMASAGEICEGFPSKRRVADPIIQLPTVSNRIEG